MAESAARREARRRRILGNPDERLKRIAKINSSNSDEPETNTSPQRLPKPTHNNSPVQCKESLDQTEPETSDTSPLIKSDGDKIADTKQSNKTDYRVIIILLLGFCIRYLNLVLEKCEYLIGIDLSGMNVDRIFIPLLCFELLDCFVGKSQFEDNQMFTMLLTLNNVDPKKVRIVLKCANFVMNLLRDVSIYFFAFIFLDLVFTFLMV